MDDSFGLLFEHNLDLPRAFFVGKTKWAELETVGNWAIGNCLSLHVL